MRSPSPALRGRRWRRSRRMRVVVIPRPSPQPSPASAGEGASTFGGPQEIGLDHTAQADRQQIALPVAGLADRSANPVLADAIFLDVAPLMTLESNADPARQHRFVVKRAIGVDAEMIGRPVGPDMRFPRPGRAAIVGIASRGNRRRLSSRAP